MDMTIGEVGAACRHAILSSRGGDTRLGLVLAQQAYRQARAIGTDEALLEGLNALAICQATSGCYIESVACAIDAFRLARRIGNRLGTLNALTTLIGASNHLLDTGGATLSMVDRTILAVTELDDLALVVRLRNLRGVILGALGRFSEGTAELSLALSLSQRSDRTTPASMIVGNLANLAVREFNNVEQAQRAALVKNAESRITDALAIAHNEKSAEAEIRAWFNSGLFRAGQNELILARDAFQRSLGLALQLKHLARAIDAKVELGSVFARLLQYEEAIHVFETAFVDADATRPSKQLHVASEQLEKIYRLLGRNREATASAETALRERKEYDRERENAARELRSFWLEIGDSLNTLT
ncbi:MAG: hypothetical protein ABI583_03680 [Betaproteobacteria bacterium]